MAARTIAAAIAITIPAFVAVSGTASAQASPVVQKSGTARQPTIMHVVVEDVTMHQEMFSMRADLRRLVVAQETYWRAQKTYASDLSGLPKFQETPGVVVQIIRSRPDGWAARATYGDAIGAARSCVVWVGDIPATERPTTDVERKSYPEAEASCDGDGYTAKGEWTSAGRSYMTYALARLVRSESRFYAYHRRYTKDPSTLDPFIWDNDVSVTITTATPTGWAARATFAGNTGKSCIVWHGTLDPSDVPITVGHVTATVDSRVSCDGDR